MCRVRVVVRIRVGLGCGCGSGSRSGHGCGSGLVRVSSTCPHVHPLLVGVHQGGLGAEQTDDSTHLRLKPRTGAGLSLGVGVEVRQGARVMIGLGSRQEGGVGPGTQS